MNPCQDCIVSIVCINPCEEYKPAAENMNTCIEYIRATVYVERKWGPHSSYHITVKKDVCELEIWSHTIFFNSRNRTRSARSRRMLIERAALGLKPFG